MSDDRAAAKLERVGILVDDDRLDWQKSDNSAAIVGERGFAATGTQGVSYAGANGEAVSQRYGVAIVGPNGKAHGGAGSVVCAYDGGSASGGDGAVAWARRGGPASTGSYGIASVLDSQSSGMTGSVAVALRQNSKKVSASVGSYGVALVQNHTVLNAASGPAIAIAGAHSLAIAFDGNHVQGAVGALLVTSYTRKGQKHFAVGIVDGVNLMPDMPYRADNDGNFVKV